MRHPNRDSPAKPSISNLSCRASRATPSSSRRSRSVAASAARCHVNCGQLDPGAVIRPGPGEWHARTSECALAATTAWPDVDRCVWVDWRSWAAHGDPRSAARRRPTARI